MSALPTLCRYGKTRIYVTVDPDAREPLVN